MVITTDPCARIRNVGMYRVQVLGRNTLAMHWQRHKVGAAHWREMAERGERMPVVIALGGDPASIYSGSAPLPPTIDEFIFAGFLRREPVELAKAVTCDLDVPAEAEIVLEGYIDPAEPLVLEGPFGDHTGFYSLADYYPWCTSPPSRLGATRSTRPRWWARRRWRTIISATRPSGSSCRCSSSPSPRSWTTTCRPPGIFHNLVFVSIDKQYPGQAYKVMNALWGQGLMSLAKVLVIVDKHVNVQDPDEAWWIALNNIDPERDVRFTMGPVDVLDHASRGFTYRQQDGNRRDAEVEGGGIHAGVAGADQDGRGDQAAGGRDCGRGWGSACDLSPRARARHSPASRSSSATSTSSSFRTRSSRCRSRCSACWRPRGRRRSRSRMVVLVVVAFSAARWAAMGFNRIADRDSTRATRARGTGSCRAVR